MNSRFIFRNIPKLLYGFGLHKPVTSICNTPGQFFYRSASHNLQNVETFQHIQARHYSKSKDKGGKDKKNKQGKVEISLSEISALINVDKFKEQLQHLLDSLQDSFVQHVSLRSSSGSIESIPVAFEGTKYELQELAQVVRKNPKTVVLNMATFPQAIPTVLEAINSSGLNLNPQQDGTTVFIPIPKVTKEHREHLAKNAKVLYVQCCNKLKDVQADYIRKTKKQTGVSEDTIFSVNKQIVALTEEYLKKARTAYLSKHDELLK